MLSEEKRGLWSHCYIIYYTSQGILSILNNSFIWKTFYIDNGRKRFFNKLLLLIELNLTWQFLSLPSTLFIGIHHGIWCKRRIDILLTSGVSFDERWKSRYLGRKRQIGLHPDCGHFLWPIKEKCPQSRIGGEKQKWPYFRLKTRLIMWTKYRKIH